MPKRLPLPVLLAILLLLTAGGLFIATTVNPNLLRTQVSTTQNNLTGSVPRHRFFRDRHTLSVRVRLHDGSIRQTDAPVQFASNSSSPNPVSSPDPVGDPNQISLSILNTQPISLTTSDEGVYIGVNYGHFDQIYCGGFEINGTSAPFRNDSIYSNFIGLCPPRPGQPPYDYSHYNPLATRPFNPNQKTLIISRDYFQPGANTLTSFFQLRDGQTVEQTLTVDLDNQAPTENSGPTCGNGLLDEGESCDFGANASGFTGCSDNCQLTTSSCPLEANETILGSAPVRPGDVVTLSSSCFTNGDPITVLTIDNQSGSSTALAPPIDPNRQEGLIPGVYRRSLGNGIERGRRGIYLLRDGVIIGSDFLNVL